MEVEVAFLCTIVVIFLSWLYLNGPRKRRAQHSCSKNSSSPRANILAENDAGMDAREQRTEESDGGEMLKRRKSSGAESQKNDGENQERKSSRSQAGHKGSTAGLERDDVAELIIDPRDIKPVPVGLRMPAESSDPESVKQYVKDLRAHQEDDMTEEELQQEKEVQQQQLAEIFRLMQNSQEKFGIESIDDIEEQMKLYSKT